MEIHPRQPRGKKKKREINIGDGNLHNLLAVPYMVVETQVSMPLSRARCAIDKMRYQSYRLNNVLSAAIEI